MSHQQDQRARERAIDPHESFIIQAPAGSGKTELLTQRFLRLLSTTPSHPEEIIAITFTKKAAAEMRERIIDALQASLAMKPSEPHKQLTWQLAKDALARDKQENWQILTNPNRLRVMTIDSLSMHINQFAPLLSGLGSQPAILDDATPLYQRATEALFQQHNAGPIQDALATLLLHVDNRVEYAMELLRLMLSKREQWLPHIASQHGEQDHIRAALEQALETVATETQTHCLNLLPVHLRAPLCQSLTAAGQHLQEHDPEHPLSILSQLASLEPTQPPSLEQLARIGDTLLTKTGDLRKSLTKRQGCPAKSAHKIALMELLPTLAELPEWLHALRQCQLCPPTHYRDSQWELLCALITLLPMLVAHLHVAMQESGGIDFTEITLSALRTLGDETNPTDLALYFDHRIHHLLIDEFQDTSVTQFSLFEKLIAGWVPGDGRTLFLVGDPMQSIYRFRNAEVSLFLNAKQHGIGDIQPAFLQLSLNFRSRDTIVNWVNNAFHTIMPQHSNTATGAVPFSPAIAANATAGDVHYLACDDDHPQPHQAMIAALKRIPPEESTAILVRSRNQLRDIIPALQTAGIAFQAIDIEPLLNKAEVQDLYQLTLALLHLDDRIAWYSILRAPWCGLSLSDLHHLNQYAQATLLTGLQHPECIAGLTPDGQARVTHFMAAILPCLQERGKTPLHQRVRSAWARLGGQQQLTTPTAQQNAERYLDLLLHISEQQGMVLRHDLAREIEKLYATQANSQANIHIMTIHKSKGLEFDHVFLPCLQHHSHNSDSPLLQWLQRPTQQGDIQLLLAPIKPTGEDADPIYAYLDRSEKHKLTLETSRLFYVACTRAKQQLYLLCTLSRTTAGDISQPRKGSYLQLLWEHYADRFLTDLAESEKAEPSPEPAIINAPPRLQRLCPSALTSALPALPSSEHARPPKLTISTAPEVPRLIGIIIHAELQYLSDIGLTQWHTIDTKTHRSRWQRQLRQHHVTTPSDIDTALTKIDNAITATLQCDHGKWLLSNDHEFSASEYALSSIDSNTIQHHIVDRLIVTQSTVWVIDFKTASPDSPQSEAVFINEEIRRYQPQLKRYAEIIQSQYDLPIHTALYFPLCQHRWQPVSTSLTTATPT